MAEETQYTAKNGLVVISTANANLDGTGTLGTVLTAGSNGMLLKSVCIKAQVATTQGVVRLFITGGGNTRLFQEIEIPGVTPSATDKSFEIKLDLNYALQSGYVLKASTQNAETFGIVAEGLNWAYYGASVRTDTTQYTAINGLTNMSTANSHLDGTGTLELAYLYTATYGISIESITIKAIVSTTPGMIRFYISDGVVTPILFKEVAVPAQTKSAKVNAFEHTIVFDDDFELQNNYYLYASTEKGESFKLFTVGLVRSYAA